MTLYLDTSVAVSLFADDAHTERAERLISAPVDLIVSDLTAVEFASALAIQHRSGHRTQGEIRAAFALFDRWCDDYSHRETISAADLRSAEQMIRALDMALKAPDATHIAMAERLGASLATFDTTIAREARRQGLNVVEA